MKSQPTPYISSIAPPLRRPPGDKVPSLKLKPKPRKNQTSKDVIKVKNLTHLPYSIIEDINNSNLLALPIQEENESFLLKLEKQHSSPTKQRIPSISSPLKGMFKERKVAHKLAPSFKIRKVSASFKKGLEKMLPESESMNSVTA